MKATHITHHPHICYWIENLGADHSNRHLRFFVSDIIERRDKLGLKFPRLGLQKSISSTLKYCP